MNLYMQKGRIVHRQIKKPACRQIAEYCEELLQTRGGGRGQRGNDDEDGPSGAGISGAGIGTQYGRMGDNNRKKLGQNRRSKVRDVFQK